MLSCTPNFGVLINVFLSYLNITTFDLFWYMQASGLAAGKGVIIPSSLDESLQAIDDIMIKKVFGGSAGSEVVVEQFLDGEEVSVLAFCDGVKAAPMPPAQVVLNSLC